MTKTLTKSEKAQVRQLVLDRYESKDGRNVMIRRDGAVVITIDGQQGTSQIFAGWDTDLIKEC